MPALSVGNMDPDKCYLQLNGGNMGNCFGCDFVLCDFCLVFHSAVLFRFFGRVQYANLQELHLRR